MKQTVMMLVVGLMMVPMTALAAGGEGVPQPHWNELISAIVNFTIYIGAIVYFARGPIAKHFAARREGVVSLMERSKREQEEARAQLDAYRAQLDALDSERQAILDNYRALGEAESARIVEEATAQAQKIRTDAKAMAKSEARRAAAQLEAQLVDAALVMARDEVRGRLNPAAQARLVDATITELTQLGNAN